MFPRRSASASYDLATDSLTHLANNTYDLLGGHFGIDSRHVEWRALRLVGLNHEDLAISPLHTNGTFTRAFADKGRFVELLRSIEVTVALSLRAPLIGAAHYSLILVDRRSSPHERG